MMSELLLTIGLTAVEMTHVGAILCLCTVLMFGGISAILLMIGFYTSCIAYSSWMLSVEAVGLF